MSKLGTVIRAIIDATHEIALLYSRWETDAGNYHSLTLLSVGWGALLFGSYDGQPTLGIQVGFGGLALWCGPLFRRFDRTCRACTDEPCIDHVKL